MLAARGGPACILATHAARAFALASGTYMRLALLLLLTGSAGRFLAFRPAKVAAGTSLAFIFGTALFLQRNRNRLPAVLYLASPSAWAARELAMFEFVHDPARDPPL